MNAESVRCVTNADYILGSSFADGSANQKTNSSSVSSYRLALRYNSYHTKAINGGTPVNIARGDARTVINRRPPRSHNAARTNDPKVGILNWRSGTRIWPLHDGHSKLIFAIAFSHDTFSRHKGQVARISKLNLRKRIHRGIPDRAPIARSSLLFQRTPRKISTELPTKSAEPRVRTEVYLDRRSCVTG